MSGYDKRLWRAGVWLTKHFQNYMGINKLMVELLCFFLFFIEITGFAHRAIEL